MISRIGFVSALVAAVAATALPEARGAGADPLKDLSGRWSGWGAITFSGGQTERIKCVASYFVHSEAIALRLSLVCASATYRIDAKADMEIAGARVTGRWHETVNKASGSLGGTRSGADFELSISAEGFAAGLTIRSEGSCRQRVLLEPLATTVKRIEITLSRC